MCRRRIWEVCCAPRDAVLWTSFTWEELQLIADSLGFELEYPPVEHPAGRVAAVMSAIHHACHMRSVFSERVQEHLEGIHGEAIRCIEAADAEEVRDWCVLPLGDRRVGLSGLVWAVVSDPRPEMRSIEEFLVWRVQTEGIRTLAFGKVEVIRV